MMETTIHNATWRDYYDLCKPKVVALLLLTSIVGVVLASPPGDISLFILIFSTLGIGLAAAAGQHLLLNAPNGCGGHQQTAQMMADDILAEPLPIAMGPKWGRIDRPGLGVDVDQDKLMRYHEAYRRDGQFLPYGERY